MRMLRIVKDKALSLHCRSKEVALPLSKEDKDLLGEMIQYLRDSQDPVFKESHPKVREGVGLAAPQIGVNKRMLVISYPTGEEDGSKIEHMFVNPEIVSSSIKECYLTGGEGCLSVDEAHPGKVYRPYRITVKALEASTMENVTIKAIGYDAIVIQHEIDHLDGVLFYDHINKNAPEEIKPGTIAI